MFVDTYSLVSENIAIRPVLAKRFAINVTLQTSIVDYTSDLYNSKPVKLSDLQAPIEINATFIDYDDDYNDEGATKISSLSAAAVGPMSDGKAKYVDINDHNVLMYDLHLHSHPQRRHA